MDVLVLGNHVLERKRSTTEDAEDAEEKSYAVVNQTTI
jgi:hypothetical protein